VAADWQLWGLMIAKTSECQLVSIDPQLWGTASGDVDAIVGCPGFASAGQFPMNLVCALACYRQVAVMLNCCFDSRDQVLYICENIIGVSSQCWSQL